jgi:hypothetical protein
MLLYGINPEAIGIPVVPIDYRVNPQSFTNMEICEYTGTEPITDAIYNTVYQVLNQHFDTPHEQETRAEIINEVRFHIGHQLSFVFCRLIKVFGVIIVHDSIISQNIGQFIQQFSQHTCDQDITAKVIITIWLKNLFSLLMTIFEKHDEKTAETKAKSLLSQLVITTTPVIYGVDVYNVPPGVNSTKSNMCITPDFPELNSLAYASQKRFLASLVEKQCPHLTSHKAINNYINRRKQNIRKIGTRGKSHSQLRRQCKPLTPDYNLLKPNKGNISYIVGYLTNIPLVMDYSIKLTTYIICLHDTKTIESISDGNRNTCSVIENTSIT